jgi:DNA replication protein DnaC
MAFLGSPGCGKTHLAVGVALRVMKKHNGGVLMVKSSAIAAAVKDTFNSRRSETSVIERYAKVGLLIIDEVCEDISDFDRRVLFDVIDRRYNAELPMIIISNLDASQFKTAVGERAYDRLRENHVYVPFCWDSYRVK